MTVAAIISLARVCFLVVQVSLFLVTEKNAIIALNVVSASSPLCAWVGRTQARGDAIYFDWEGVSVSVTVSNFSWVGVEIADNCVGTIVGGGSRWLVEMSSPPIFNAAPLNHRITTFYSGPRSNFYYLFNNPGKNCDPNCNIDTNVTFKLTRLTESRLSGCTPDNNLTIYSFLSDGEFLRQIHAVAPRRLEFVGDSISAGDLNDNEGAPICANAAYNNDITLSTGGVLCGPESQGGFSADCMFTAWGGIQLGIDGQWGMSLLYPFLFSAGGQNVYEVWNFSVFPVDAVVVNLGTNDHPIPPAIDWQNNYVQFVKKIVLTYYKNPSLIIFLAYGPMSTEYQPMVINITATLKAYGINANILDLTLTHGLTGCYGHPSAADNRKIAAKARPQIAAVMNWS